MAGRMEVFNFQYCFAAGKQRRLCCDIVIGNATTTQVFHDGSIQYRLFMLPSDLLKYHSLKQLFPCALQMLFLSSTNNCGNHSNE